MGNTKKLEFYVRKDIPVATEGPLSGGGGTGKITRHVSLIDSNCILHFSYCPCSLFGIILFTVF